MSAQVIPHAPASDADAESTASAAGSTAAAVERNAIEWTFDPWRERPGRSGLAAACCLGGLAVLVSLGEPLLFTLALGAALFASLGPGLLAVRCRVDGSGAARRGVLGSTARRWEEVRRVERRRGGLLLSPFSLPSWLDATRGLFLPLPDSGGGALATAVLGLPAIQERMRRHDP